MRLEVPPRHCERSEAIHVSACGAMDCFVAVAPRNDGRIVGDMKIFCTGASGYIGGSVAAHLVAAGHQVAGLVRSPEKADAVRARGIEPLLGTLDDARSWRERRRPPTSSSMRRAPITRARSLRCSMRWPEAANRSSIHRDRASSARAPEGERSDAVFDEDTPFTPSPARAARVALNELILSYRDKGCRPVIICPSLIYGLGLGAEPRQHAGAAADRAGEKTRQCAPMPAPARTSGRTCISTIS